MVSPLGVLTRAIGAAGDLISVESLAAGDITTVALATSDDEE